MANLQKNGMPYVCLGNSGLKVSKIILGCLSYGSPVWSSWVLPEEESIKHIKAAYDAGINTFDTANAYSYGESERILGKAIKQLNLPRDNIVIMTKLYFPVRREHSGANPDDVGYVNRHGLSRKHIFESVKHSLERLRLDCIDLLQCHRFDYDTPIEETMQALHDVVKAGHVHYIGMSSCWAWQFHAMQNYAIANKLTPFILMQNQYNLIYREEEREMFPTLKYFGVGSIPYSPLSYGVLARPTRLSESTARGKVIAPPEHESEAAATIINRVEEVAKRRGISMAQVSLAWLFQKDGVTAPIVGVTSLDHIQDIIRSVYVQLTFDDVKYLEEPYAPQAIIAHT